MIKWLLGVAALSFAVSPWASELSQVEDATTLIQVLDKNNKHVGHGSGFLITPEGHIATNDHVVRDAEKLKVFGGQFAKGMPARIVWQDKNLDLAIKVTDTRQPFAALVYSQPPLSKLSTYTHMDIPVHKLNTCRGQRIGDRLTYCIERNHLKELSIEVRRFIDSALR